MAREPYKVPDVTVYERISSLENDVAEMKTQMGNLWDLYQKAQGVMWLIVTIGTIILSLMSVAAVFWDHF